MIKKRSLIPAILFLLLISCFIWWNTPVSFLKSIHADEVTVISVRNGQTGNCYDISDREHILHIVESIQKPAFQKTGVSLLHMGTFLTLSFYKGNGSLAGRLILNSDRNIRKDPFFYQAEEGAMQIVDFLSALEQ